MESSSTTRPIASTSAFSNWFGRRRSGKGKQSPEPIVVEDLSIVQMPGGDVVPFNRPSPAQLQLRALLANQRQAMLEGRRPKKPRRIVVVKARKLGISTEAQAQAFVMASNRPNTECLIISHEAKSAQLLFGISERFYRCLAPEKKPPRKFWNRRAIVFDEPINSSLAVDVVSEGAGRSGTFRFLHCSEVAFWGDLAEETLLALRNSMPTEEDCIEIDESTGYGQGGCFFQEYYRAKERGEALFCPWWQDERYRLLPGLPEAEWSDFERAEAKKYGLSDTQVAWMRYAFEEKTSKEDPREREQQFRQEYPGCEDDAFQGDARGVFSRELIELVQAQVKDAALDLKFVRGIPHAEHELLAGLTRVDETPQAAYVIGADPAEGLEGGDASAAVVLNRVSGRIEAYLKGSHDTEQFARALADLGRYYNRAWIVVERNGPGHRVLSALRSSDYPRLWSERQPWTRAATLSPALGWNTTKGSKMQAIGAYIARLRTGRVFVPFSPILDEMRTYLYDKVGKPGAVSGCHDDLISAIIIASAAGDELGTSDPVMEDLKRMEKIRIGDHKWRRGDIDRLAEMQYGVDMREEQG
jgi:hypothetical protein